VAQAIRVWVGFFLALTMVACGDEGGATLPTNENACRQFWDSYCQRAVVCDMSCEAGGPALTSVSACYACLGVTDRCSAKANAADTLSSDLNAELDQCLADFPSAACADVGAGNFPSTCYSFQ